MPPQALGAPQAAPTVEFDAPWLHGRLADVAPIALEPATTAAAVREWNAAVECHHPLGYRRAFGFRLRCYIRRSVRPLGCVLLSGAARALAVRNQCVGWERCERQANLSRVVNNSRFLILPEVRIPPFGQPHPWAVGAPGGRGLGTALGVSSAVAGDLRRPAPLSRYLLSGRRMGTGATTGQCLARPGRTYTGTLRPVFVKPLAGDFRQGLRAGAVTGRAAS